MSALRARRGQPTFTGKFIDVLELTVDDIDIRDIAHHLSQVNRYIGATELPYSVGQHSWYVSKLLDWPLALPGLLHDSPEAYLGDLSHHLKHRTPAGDGYKPLEAAVEAIVEKKFGLWHGALSEADVKRADDIVLELEWAALIDKNPDATFPIDCWPSKVAERRFLSRFAFLTG